MEISIAQHRKLLIQEYLLQKHEFDKVLNTRAVSLRDKGKLYVSQYVGFDGIRGNILLKLSSRHPFPRRNEHLSAFISGKEFINPKSWASNSYETIRFTAQRFCELTPVWFKYDSDNTVLIGFRGADSSFMDGLPSNIPIILGPQEPPTEYLRNLIFLLDNTPLFPRFQEIVSIDIGQIMWNPEALRNDNDTALQLSADLTIHQDVIIQGPPGTGKSFLIANLCRDFLRQGKRVLLAALTNTALIELAQKDGLKELLLEGRVYKSSLTLDESTQVRGIKSDTEFTDQSGTLLLSTFYKASNRAKSASSAQFDLVVIEEASQAYLATIGALRHLGQKCIIIGDQNQLQPIRVLHDHDLESPHLACVFEGLSAIANTNLTASKFILNQTYRLNPSTTHLTNVFYNDSLQSIQPELKALNISGCDDILPSGKSVCQLKLPMQGGSKAPANAISVIKDLVIKIRKLNPKSEIAVLSVFVDTVKALQQSIEPNMPGNHHLIIDTVDRIQGLTVDICIFFIPNAGINFSLKPNRFNVATSRAKHFTWIVTPADLVVSGYDERVVNYFERLEK